MTTDCSALTDALDTLRNSIGCRASQDGQTMIVSTGHLYSDGEPVEMLVRPSNDGERFVISDGGVTRARLDLTGSGPGTGRARELWADILTEFGVEEAADRLYVVALRGAAAAGISRLADACVSVDNVHLLSGRERLTFTDKVRQWLTADAHIGIQGKSVLDQYGDSQTVTAVVDSPRGQVVVQAAGGQRITDLKSSFEHAYWVFSGMDTTAFSPDNRLVVVEAIPRRDDSYRRARSMVTRLTSVAHVGSFERQIALQSFLTDKMAPRVRDLAFETYGQLPTN